MEDHSFINPLPSTVDLLTPVGILRIRNQWSFKKQLLWLVHVLAGHEGTQAACISTRKLFCRNSAQEALSQAQMRSCTKCVVGVPQGVPVMSMS
eukprot:672222-Pelagomonas_calceolata.AAC.1